MDRKAFTILFLIILAGCTKVEDIYIHEEPSKPPVNYPPGSFTVRVNSIKDIGAVISWSKALDPDNKEIRYDVAINDSIIAYNLNAITFEVERLQPDSHYKFTVYALDSLRNYSSASIDTQTRKSFFKEVIAINLNIRENYTLNIAVETSDGGIVAGGIGRDRITEFNNRDFLVKISPGYTLEWKLFIDPPAEFKDRPNYVNDLLETSDGGFLAVTDHRVTKISRGGGIIWTYNSPETHSFATLVCASEDTKGNLIVAGNLFVQKVGFVSKTYFVVKLDPNGKEIWKKYSEDKNFGNLSDILVNNDGKILLCGVDTWSFLLWLDETGNYLNKRVYESYYKGGGDVSELLIRTKDDNYLLAGSSHGFLSGSFNSIPRFLKVSITGDVILDKYHYLNSGGCFPSFTSLDNLETGYVVLTTDDRGIAISTLDESLDVTLHYGLYEFPPAIFIKYSNKDREYHCLNRDATLMKFNIGGYWDGSWSY